MKLFEKYKKLNMNRRYISLEYRENDDPYFCYPINAEVIGFEENILYCFIPEYGEMVFASNPETCADYHVYPLARNFEVFLRLILACGSANPIEQIIWMNKERFENHLIEERKNQTQEQIKLLAEIQEVFNLMPMENPFEYVKELQRNFNGSSIQFSDDYYDIKGLDNPNLSKHKHCFEFEPVTFQFEKEE